MRSKKPFSAGKSAYVIFIALWLASIVVPAQTQAQTFKVLHTFHGRDGALPSGQLARDGAGNLYGTTEGGGTGKCEGHLHNWCGTAFMLDKSGRQVWLHSFNGRDGEEPLAGLLRDGAGHLFGTTVEGGDTACYSLGCGTVFSLGRNGGEKLLHEFAGAPDGSFPAGPLTQDAADNLYGTTQFGGSSGSGYGTVFKVDKAGNETVLYSFTGGSDGCAPDGGVILDAAGNLYGVATDCGGGYGVVYELGPGGDLSVLHAFGGGDGAYPASALIFDSAGNLYGTTQEGGSSDVCDGGCGTAFELSPNGNGSWTETVLYSFCSLQNCADGQNPAAGLVRDKGGSLFGTTEFGGASRCGGAGCGVVFELASGGETVLYSFTGGADGFQPSGVLVQSPAGTLYGVATSGGDASCFSPEGCGLVFRLTL